MADRQVTITISAQDQFSSVMNKYQQAMNDAGTATQKLGETTEQNFGQKLNDALQGIEASIVAVGAAYATFDRAISAGEDVVRVNAAFEAMAGSTEAAAEGQQQLAAATRGLVDDEQAMAGATKLLSLGLADNTQQAANFVGVGAQLGRVFNGDAAGGITTFINVLQNESPRALAQFGISSDDVKKKVDALVKSGMDAREAFRQVVLQEANDRLKQLGDNAVMAGSDLDRLKIQFQDTIETIEARAAQGFEALVGIVQYYTGQMAVASNTASSIPMTNTTTTNRSGGMIQGYVSPEQLQALQNAGNAAPETQAPALNVYQQMAAEATKYWEYVNRQQTELNFRMQEGSTTANIAAAQRQAAALQTYEIEDNIHNSQMAQAQAQQEITAQTELQAQAAQNVNAALGTGFGGMSGQIQQLQDLMGSRNGSGLFTDDDAYKAQSIANNLRTQADYVSQMADQYPGMISDNLVQRAQNMADSAQNMADQAERGAQAFDNMSLSDLLGQGTGGVAGQLEGMVTQWLQGQNLTADKYQQIVDSMDLVTGKATEASQFLSEQVIPALGVLAQQNPTAAANAMLAEQDYLKRQALNGQAPTPQGELNAAGLMQLPGGASRQISVQPGMTAQQAADFNNITVDQLILTTGAMNANTIPVGTFSMPGGQIVPNQVMGITLGPNSGEQSQGGNNLMSGVNTMVDTTGQTTGAAAISQPVQQAQDLSNALSDSADYSDKTAQNTANISQNVTTSATQAGLMQTSMGKVRDATDGIKNNLQIVTSRINQVSVALVVTAVDDRTGKFDGFIQALMGPAIGTTNPTSSQGVGVGQAAPGGIAGSGRGR